MADSVFKVDPSVVVGDDDTVVQATLVNTANDVRFKLELWPIRQSDGGLFRVTIREAYPLKERFQPAKEVLVSETPEVARQVSILTLHSTVEEVRTVVSYQNDSFSSKQMSIFQVENYRTEQ